MNILSLGAGVQSTTMLLMALAGELEPLPDAAVFADTGWEPAAVYAHLDWCEAQMAGRIPLYRVSGGDLRADVMGYAAGTNKRGLAIPAYMTTLGGDEAPLRRQCTTEYKIVPISRQIKRLGATASNPATVWLGISLDEVGRMKESREPHVVRRWPLIERRLSRHDCLLWLERHGYPRPPRSSCIGCPYRSNAEWRTIRADPAAWADAIEDDAAIRHMIKKANAAVFLHRSLVPLPMVDLSTPQERGQLELWDEECSGMCGV
jgi:hypothetical protein